ncbi:MAG: hypothetical protein D6731_05590 [Planctomycetota bacterium]|nr:MAG: hypothetical protein D6731_05590 [Planctomycetota bacterium]
MKAPAEIDGYRVVGVLGRGGMGEVFEVEDPAVGRRLALKLGPGPGAEPDEQERFAREGEVLARVRHPNLVRVHAVGRSERGAYLLMERVEGEPLDRVLEAGALPPQQAASLVRELAGAVAALHAAGVVHRDIKPQNVLLRADGSPVLVDLGLALDTSKERLSRTGSLLGTPACMSPEQARGDPRAVGPASDVYALGALLFWLLCGRPLFGSLGGLPLLDAVARLEPEWPPDAGHVPSALRALCLRALAKRPEARPRLEEWRSGLEAYLEGRQDAPPGRRRRAVLLGAAVGGGLVGVALMAVFLGGRRAAEPRGVLPAPGGGVVGPPAGTSPPGGGRRAERSAEPVPSGLVAALNDGRASEEDFARARELLAAGGKGTARLRRAYLRGRLASGAPRVVARLGEGPRHGRVCWFDEDRFLWVGREQDVVLGWRRGSDAEPVFRAAASREKGWRETRPRVAWERLWLSGGEGGRELRARAWGSGPPLLSSPGEGTVTAVALGRRGEQRLLAVARRPKRVQDPARIVVYSLEDGGLRAVQRLEGGHAATFSRSGLEDERPPLVTDLVFADEGRLLVSAGHAGWVCEWDLSPVGAEAAASSRPRARLLVSTKRRLTLPHRPGAAVGLALRPGSEEQSVAVAAGSAGSVYLLELPGLRLRTHYELRAGVRAREVLFSPDGRFLYLVGGGRLAEGALRGALFAVDLEADAVVTERGFSDWELRSFDVSPGGRRLLVAAEAGSGSAAQLWEWEVDVPPERR